MGGVENHVHEVATRFGKAGVDVTVLTTDPGKHWPREEIVAGIPVLRVPAWPTRQDWYFAPGLPTYITEGAWDIVHCQGYHTFVPPLAMLAALKANIPYVLTFHGGGHSSPLRNRVRGLQQLMLRPLLARARRLIAVAEFEVDLFGSRLRLPPERFFRGYSKRSRSGRA
jgi:glycogen synthase